MIKVCPLANDNIFGLLDEKEYYYILSKTLNDKIDKFDFLLNY